MLRIGESSSSGNDIVCVELISDCQVKRADRDKLIQLHTRGVPRRKTSGGDYDERSGTITSYHTPRA
ncbi:hypothetical protein ABIF69_007569 [Bradyrhizobium japonicum]